MTVPTTARRAGPYSGNGSTTTFSFSFKTFASTDLQVTKTGTNGLETVLIKDSDYSVSLNANQETSPGGSITYPISGTALATGEKLVIVGNLAYEQTTDLLGGGAFNAQVIEDTFDRTVVQIQQLEERADRALTIPVSSTASGALPAPEAAKIIGWNQGATGLSNYDPATFVSAAYYADWVYQTFTGNGTTTSFVLTKAPGSLANMDVTIAGVSQVPSTDFILSGTTLTFTSAPPNGSTILARYGQAAQQHATAFTTYNATATASQTVFNLVGATYVPGANNLAVYVNGLRMVAGADYIETDSDTVTFNSGLTLGDEVSFVCGRELSDAIRAEQVSFVPAGTGAVARTVESKLRDEGVSPVDFGAVGNGTTNDLAAINLAANYAASVKKALVFPSGYTFAINGLITIKQGTPAVLGQGGIIKFISGPLMSGVLLAGKESGQPSNVTDCVVSGLHIEANNQWCVGIYGQNISRCQIIGNKILNIGSSGEGWGILIRSFANGLSDSTNNIIGYNLLTGDTGTAPGHYGIGLDAPINLGAYAGQGDYWKANFSAADSTYHCAFNTVIGNRVEGGYYGLSLSASRYNEVANNFFSGNIRSISVQNNCIGNNITSNYCLENYSSGIHLAYSSIYNTISSNHVYSTRAVGQGMLNCYVGCASNKFIGNNLIAAGASAPQWHIYCGVMCSGTEFIENTISGGCSKSYIAVESAWVYPVSDPPSYGYTVGAAVNGYANAGMSNIILDGNTINPASAHPGIYIHQTSESGNWPLQVTLERNKITNSTATPQLWTSEDNSGSLSGCLLLNNQFDTAVVTPGEFTLARGRAPFIKVDGNTILNDSVSSYSYPDAGATPDVSTRDYVSLAGYTTSTTVTNFTGATAGQVITVRLSTAVTIQHNANIILKGATNITSVDANKFVTLLYRGDAWIEQSRNF